MPQRLYRTKATTIEAAPSPADAETPRSYVLFAEPLAPLVIPADWFDLLFVASEPETD